MNHPSFRNREDMQAADIAIAQHEQDLLQSKIQELDKLIEDAQQAVDVDLVSRSIRKTAVLKPEEIAREESLAQLRRQRHHLQERLNAIRLGDSDADTASQHYDPRAQSVLPPNQTTHQPLDHSAEDIHIGNQQTETASQHYGPQAQSSPPANQTMHQPPDHSAEDSAFAPLLASRQVFLDDFAEPSPKKSDATLLIEQLSGFVGVPVNEHFCPHVVQGPGQSFYAIGCHICGANAPKGKWTTLFMGLSGLHRHYATRHRNQGPWVDYEVWNACDKTPVSAADVERIRGGLLPENVPGKRV